MVEAIRLNLGAGDSVIPGFQAVDLKFGGEARKIHYNDGVVEEIRASHLLEHFSHHEVPVILAEWARALRPGGKLRIAVPDFEKIKIDDRLWEAYLMGGQQHENDYHKSAYTKKTLTDLLLMAGFDNITEWKSEIEDCASLPVSLNLQGIKAAGAAPTPTSQDIKIVAVTSVPRLGWQDHFGSVQRALSPFRIPLISYTGAFWEQCIQNVLLDSVNNGVDWILTLDYDTVFDKRDLDKMLGIFGENPHIDALAALQPRRSTGEPLFTISGTAGDFPVNGDPIKCSTAHFGLTLLRAEALKTMPLPWFRSEPGPDGTWTHDAVIHPDIYFWKKWAAHGKSLFVAPTVRVGHLELLVSEFDSNMKQRHVSVPEWRKGNK